MSLSHLLNSDDAYSSILNIGCNSLTAVTINVTNFVVNMMTVINKFTLTLGLSQALTVNTQDNAINWVAGKFGSVYTSDKYAILVNLSGFATIGAHQIDSSGTILGWADLYLNQTLLANSNVFVGTTISNPKKFNVNGDMNLTGNYYLNNYNYTGFRRSLSIGGPPIGVNNGGFGTVYSFVFDPQTNGTWVSFELSFFFSGINTFDWKLINETAGTTTRGQ